MLPKCDQLGIRTEFGNRAASGAETPVLKCTLLLKFSNYWNGGGQETNSVKINEGKAP